MIVDVLVPEIKKLVICVFAVKHTLSDACDTM